MISQFPALFGKYILLDRVNAGGMAEVFRAKVTGAEHFERFLAIKCMLPQLLTDEHFIGMFIDEAKLASQLSHANVVQIYELGRQLERLYIAMELVQGHDLRHIIRVASAQNVAIPQGFAAYVISKAGAGLDYAHRKCGVDGRPLRLVHRDVSPQNILVSYDGEVKVVDFGIAKAEARATETQAGVLKGKFAYMAPEQVMGEDIDHRADIFSLGSVLYETMTGARLFDGESDMALLENVRAANLPNLATALPANSDDLQRVLRRALQRDPEQRYSYAAEMTEDLEHLLIEDRNIFGAKRAAQFMQSLFASEVVHQAELLRGYSKVTAQMCHVVTEEPASTAAETPPGAPQGAGAYRYTESLEAPAPARRHTTQRTRQTGAHRIALADHQAAARLAGDTAEENNPLTGRAGRVLKQLRLVLLTCILVLLALLGLVTSTTGLAAFAFGDLPGVRWLAPPIKRSMNKLLGQHQDVAEPPRLELPQDLSSGGEDKPDGFGWLSIRSPKSVHARLYIDGEETGFIPTGPRRLAVGRHQVRVDIGGKLKTYTVEVAPGNVSTNPKILFLER